MSMENILAWGVMNAKKNFGVNMKTKTIKEKIKKLKKELEKKKEYNMSMWNTYGSELSSGAMIAEEDAIKDKIKKLEKKLNE